MVICKYFLSGNCRYGTKCMNEHLDVKPLIKTEIEAAIKGSQWPLSCFGPFKEKPCLKNFIEDLSFEEVRYQCYEAKVTNNFDHFQRQFSQKVADAQNKFKLILAFPRDVMNMIINLYNGIEAPQTKTTVNPFATNQNIGLSQKQASFGGATNQQQYNNTVFQITNSQNLGGGGGGTVFAQSTFTPPSVFGNNPQNFSANSSFNNQPKPTFSFVQSSQNQTNAAGNFSQQQQPGLFSTTSNFGNNGINFGNNLLTQQTNAGGNLFVQPQQVQNVPINFAQNQNLNQPQNAFGNGQTQSNIGFTQNVSQPQQQLNFGQNEQTPNMQQNASFEQSISFKPINNISQSQNFFQNSEISHPANNSQQVANNKFYSELESLTPESREAFEAAEFTLGKIPTVPPPKQLCH